MHEPIRQSVAVNASPERVYAALTNSGEFTKMSDDTAAEIGTEAGSPFSCFAGMIEGRQVELVQDERIVQAWRVRNWEAGVYSIATFQLTSENGGTRIEFTHVGFPPEIRTHLESGWHENYWEPLKNYLE